MEFPQFENINEDNNQAANAYNNFENNNEIQIESLEFADNKYQGFNENFNATGLNHNNDTYNNSPWENTNFNEAAIYAHSPAGNDGFDEAERRRIEERKTEEEQRRAKIMKKMNDELRIKQEFRDKAVGYVDNWRT